jgi:hypothetical protein
VIRKAALVGCKEGPWVSLAGMLSPHLRVSLRAGTKLRVDHQNGKVMGSITVLRSGLHELYKTADFARVSVVEGDHESVLCDIISRGYPDDVQA